MSSVGIRQLKQRTGDLLRRVENGETIQITNRGRPVAVLAPLPRSGVLEPLRVCDDITPATARLEDLPEPLTSIAPMLPSQVLSDLRSGER